MSQASLADRKRSLRTTLLERRGRQDPAAVAAASQLLCRAVQAHPAWIEARGVAAFFGVRGEADTAPLLRATLAAGKSLWLPRVLGGGHMGFWPVDDLDTLVPGRMGLREPPGIGEGVTAPGPEHGVDLVLVPGLGFARDGARIGFGAGHYDRAFATRAGANLPMPTLCGVCLEAFLDPDPADGGPIPMAEHDLRMDLIASERGVAETGSL